MLARNAGAALFATGAHNYPLVYIVHIGRAH